MADDIVRTGSRVVYRNAWMSVREDDIRLRDGTTGIYGVIEKSHFVVVAALENGRLHLVEQFRYPVGGRYWELPQGSSAHATDPVAIARAELREEAGVEAENFAEAGSLFMAYGFATPHFHVFLATGLRQVGAAREHTEQDMIARSFDLAEVERMIRDGTIRDSITVAAIGLLRLKGML
jgi:8-oxo-dGTP pyrophosphatase MutT (NUDIX family)